MNHLPSPNPLFSKIPTMNAYVMKPRATPLQRLMGMVIPCLAAFWIIWVARRAEAQPTPNAPDRLTYQGFLVDANGSAVGIVINAKHDRPQELRRRV